MNTRSRLRSFTPLQRKTPLRSTRAPFPSKGAASPVVAADATGEASLEALAFPKPVHGPHSKAKLASRRPQDGGHHGPRTTKKSTYRVGADAQPLVALEGQQGLPLFPKPAPREKAERAPLKRSRMKKRRARRIDRETPREKRYKAWIHTQPCCGEGALSPLGVYHHCNRRIEQSHERCMTGIGLKSNNFRSVAMCGDFADEWEEHRGFFKGWTKEWRRVWFGARIIEANARFEAEEALEARRTAA